MKGVRSFVMAVVAVVVFVCFCFTKTNLAIAHQLIGVLRQHSSLLKWSRNFSFNWDFVNSGN